MSKSKQRVIVVFVALSFLSWVGQGFFYQKGVELRSANTVNKLEQ